MFEGATDLEVAFADVIELAIARGSTRGGAPVGRNEG
jgi:hypothetical protein